MHNFAVPAALSVLMLASCGSSVRKEFVSPSGALKLSFERGHGEEPGGYVLREKYGGELAKVQTIIQDSFSKDPPNLQKVPWSPAERTIVIHEDMTDALPYFVTFVLQKGPGSGAWTVSRADLGTRSSPSRQEFVWTDSPVPESLTDNELKVHWFRDKEDQVLPLDGLKLSSGDGPIPRP